MISKNFARCIARISGDGYLYHRYIRYSNSCPDLLNEFGEDIKKEFTGINLTHGVGNSGTPFIQIHGKKTINRFLKYLGSYKSKDIFIPRVIKEGKKSIQKEYLRALYDDEGSPSLRIFKKTKEWKRTLTLSSNSIKILREVKDILINNFDIKSNNIFRNNPNSDCDNSFVLNISGKNNFIKFREKIGFNHPLKIKRLKLIIKSYGRTHYRNNRGFNKIKKKMDLISRS